MRNPFYFGNEVYNEDFCNRMSEIDELINDVNNGLNVLLYAPRRFGKTSLLKKLQNILKEDNSTKVIFFDWMSVSSVDEFLDKYFHTIASSLESTSDKVMKLFKEELQIRPNITNGFPYYMQQLLYHVWQECEKDICDRVDDRYYLVDPFMKYWLHDMD